MLAFVCDANQIATSWLVFERQQRSTVTDVGRDSFLRETLPARVYTPYPDVQTTLKARFSAPVRYWRICIEASDIPIRHRHLETLLGSIFG